MTCGSDITVLIFATELVIDGRLVVSVDDTALPSPDVVVDLKASAVALCVINALAVRVYCALLRLNIKSTSNDRDVLLYQLAKLLL